MLTDGAGKKPALLALFYGGRNKLEVRLCCPKTMLISGKHLRVVAETLPTTSVV